MDLPGYGYAQVSHSEKDRWARLVEGYFAGKRRIALVLQLVDFRRDPSAEDRDMIQFLLDQNLPFAVVCTKADKLNKTETAAQTARYHDLLDEAEVPFLPFSAVKGAGVEDLRTLIENAL